MKIKQPNVEQMYRAILNVREWMSREGHKPGSDNWVSCLRQRGKLIDWIHEEFRLVSGLPEHSAVQWSDDYIVQEWINSRKGNLKQDDLSLGSQSVLIA